MVKWGHFDFMWPQCFLKFFFLVSVLFSFHLLVALLPVTLVSADDIRIRNTVHWVSFARERLIKTFESVQSKR